MDALLAIIAVTVLLAVFSFVVGLRTTRRSAMESRLETFRADGEGEVAAAEDTGPVLKVKKSGGVFGLFGGSEQVALSLERAGVPLRVGEYYAIRYAAALGLFILPILFSRNMFGFILAIGTGIFGYSLPAIWLGAKRSSRAKKMDAQLVEALGMVSNSLKSGYGLMQSFEFAAGQLDPPLATELKRMMRDANLGMSGEDAMRALGERVGSPDLDMVLTAINIQRAVGGNLSEILEGVAFTMRERERIRGEIVTLTSQQRMTGIVIGGLPIGMGLLFMLINPDYMGLLFTTTGGRIMLVAAVVLEFLGAMSMKRILAIDI